MSAGFTAGPWSVIDAEGGGFAIWADRPGASGCILASRNPWPHYAETSAANAHLIAAAPCLVKAIKALLDACPPDVLDSAAAGQAFAAIAKSEGRGS